MRKLRSERTACTYQAKSLHDSVAEEGGGVVVEKVMVKHSVGLVHGISDILLSERVLIDNV